VVEKINSKHNVNKKVDVFNDSGNDVCLKCKWMYGENGYLRCIHSLRKAILCNFDQMHAICILRGKVVTFFRHGGQDQIELSKISS